MLYRGFLLTVLSVGWPGRARKYKYWIQLNGDESSLFDGEATVEDYRSANHLMFKLQDIIDEILEGGDLEQIDYSV